LEVWTGGTGLKPEASYNLSLLFHITSGTL
jgi:hypothetical protein